MAQTRFTVPQGDFDLIRYPPTRDPNLRAWDAADELLLSHFAEVAAERTVARVFVVNDAFGALTVGVTAAMGSHDSNRVHFISDSHVSTLAMRQNVERNGLPRPSEWAMGDDGVWSVEAGSTDAEGVDAQSPAPQGIDVILAKVPKALSLLETQLVSLRSVMNASTVIVGGGMTRDIHASTIQLFEQTVGPTRTSLAKKKARLILAEVDESLSPQPPRPLLYALGIGTAHLVNHPGVFSAKRLDNGTRLLLGNLPATADGPDVIDLGCGNGALGVAVLLKDPTAHITFVDESRLAVKSAEATYRRAFPGSAAAGIPKPVFRVADCLDGLPGDSADLILCNPPFHQGRAHGDTVAWKMFTGAKRVLRAGGQLWVVGNRHLEYHEKLKRALGNSQIMASDPKYQVIRAIR